MQETWVQTLCWGDPPEKGMATHSSILAWRILWTHHGAAKIWTQLSDYHFHFQAGECMYGNIFYTFYSIFPMAYVHLDTVLWVNR